MWEGTGVRQYHCVFVCVYVSPQSCVCVCVCAKKAGASTLVRHKKYARPLVCLACCCAFAEEVNICGTVSMVRSLILMLATHYFVIFQISIGKLNEKLIPRTVSMIFCNKTGESPPAPPTPGENGTRSRKAPHGGAVFLV